MKSITRLIFLAILLMGSTLRAQEPIPLPNGSFEHWTSHPGYGVQLLFFNMPVYDTFSTPDSWNYLSYPVNESVSFMGMNININTSVPVVKATRETGVVPDSNKAVKLQTIMIGDIVNSTVLSLAGDAIDSSLTQQVIPSILVTGAVDIDAFIPIVSDLFSGTGDILSMLPSLLAMDVNDFVTGGLSLADIRPGRLTGSYKYHSAVEGDNGAVVMLGTHYNTALHKRDIVGVGINLALFDTAEYTPFEVEYLPLGEFVPGTPNVMADSLIVVILSSAGYNMQQGSYLCVDNLQLWPAPDTCSDVTGLTVVPGIHDAVLSWGVNDTVGSFELEYGRAGFTQGTGTFVELTGTSFSFEGLGADTEYDVYVRTLCSDTIYGEWSLLHFATNPDTCATILYIWLQPLHDTKPLLFDIEWMGSSEPDHWEVSYGLQGFIPGTGTTVTTTEAAFGISELEQTHVLRPNTGYDFYVRSVCEDSVYGEWDSVHYHTHCGGIVHQSVIIHDANLEVNANNLIEGYSISWTDTNRDNHSWSVYYGIYNSRIPDSWGTYVEVDTPYFAFPPLRPDAHYTVIITPYCGEGNEGLSEITVFNTLELTGIDPVNQSVQDMIKVYPNPAHGQCEVSLVDKQPAELKLFSLDGRLLQTVTTLGNPVRLQLPSPGLFLLQANTPTGCTTYKVVNR